LRIPDQLLLVDRDHRLPGIQRPRGGGGEVLELGVAVGVRGALLGQLQDPHGNPITINGLWGIAFGNGGLAGDTNLLFFASGLNDEADGLFGALSAG
jgi:hypothetical protein